MKEETTYHIPVLLMPSVDGMDIRPDGTYVDVTFGGGGHSREILSRLGKGGRLLGFDQDEDAEQNIVNDPHFTLYAATSAICIISCAITVSSKWMPYLPTSVCHHTTSMTASGDFLSVSTERSICV